MRKTLLLIALIGIGLSGCTTSYPGSPQTYAGINHGKIKIDPKTGLIEVDITGGKEGENVEFILEGPNGWKAAYKATGLKAADAQAQQTAANIAVMDKLIDRIPVLP